jgi:2-(1,2-epoxy-1,2-dihydrophenyl)acetyl-CoA isomerase
VTALPAVPDTLVEVEKGIAWVTLNRPEAHNALTTAQRDGLGDLFRAASADVEVRALVLTGSGKGFCTGADLRSRPPAAPRPEGVPERTMGDMARVIREGWQRLIASILDCEKPVLAAVNGTAAGGGMHLALACDLVLMADTAKFVSAFVRRGILPDAGGAYLLARLVGPQRAKEVVFFGADIGAAEAERLGLVNRVVPAAELEATVREWAERLAAGPTKAIGAAKLLVNRALEQDRAAAFHDEAWLQEMVAQTGDAAEGIASFVDRRPPEFRGW